MMACLASGMVRDRAWIEQRAFRRANLAGTSATGGVLALMGDDHMGESSTVCHQSEYAMMDVMIRCNAIWKRWWILACMVGRYLVMPASGGIKCVKDNIGSSASVSLTPDTSAK